MQIDLTEQEHFHLQELLIRAREENEKELSVADNHKWKNRVATEQKNLESIFTKIS